MIRKSLALLVAILVGMPWAVLPASAGNACDRGMPKAKAPCSYCAPESRPAPAATTLSAGCCSYAARPDATPAQAGGIGSAPRPQASPEAPVAALPSLDAIQLSMDGRILRTQGPALPSHAPPTETIRLRL